VATQVSLATEYLTSPEVTCGKPPKVAIGGTPTRPRYFPRRRRPFLPFPLLARQTLRRLTTPVNDDAWHAVPHRGVDTVYKRTCVRNRFGERDRMYFSFFLLPPPSSVRDLLSCVSQNSFLPWPSNVSILDFGQSLQRYVRFVFIARSRISISRNFIVNPGIYNTTVYIFAFKVA